MRLFGKKFGEGESKPEVDSSISKQEELIEYYKSSCEGAEQQIKSIENLGVSLQIWKRFFGTKNMEKEAQLAEDVEQMNNEHKKNWEQQHEILTLIKNNIETFDNLEKAKEFADTKHKELKQLQDLEKELTRNLITEITKMQKMGENIENFEEEFEKAEKEVLAGTEEQ